MSAKMMIYRFGLVMLVFGLLLSCAQSQPDQETSSIEKQAPKDTGAAPEPVMEEPVQSQAKISRFKPKPAPFRRSIGDMVHRRESVNTEKYQHLAESQVQRVKDQPVSTFSIDVDTGSYSNVRRFLKQGQLPVRDAVRVEELVNYFDYHYPLPKKDRPFRVYTEMAPTPWNKDTYLLHIGIKGYDVDRRHLPASNLVFLIDVSGSMDSPHKLPLLVSSLKLLTKQLKRSDRISMVVYAGAAGVVLEPTSGKEQKTIIAALERLHAGGSTNGGQGIKLAYAMAEKSFIKNGINRILLATDGDFNVGTVNFQALKNLVEEKRQSGISLTTLGFGSGNYNDQLMEQLADAGNGNHAYIDTLQEAKKVLVRQMSSTLHTIAKDVKIQVEFNPRQVSEYRLIGYENRRLKREDFKNDKVDAGEIGAGHTVTAMYEIALSGGKGRLIDDLRYEEKQRTENQADEKRGGEKGDELAFLKLRYKKPDSDESTPLEIAIKSSDLKKSFGKTSKDFRFSAAVAAFGQRLRGGKYLKSFGFVQIRNLARKAKGDDEFGYRQGFIELVELAHALSSPSAKEE